MLCSCSNKEEESPGPLTYNKNKAQKSEDAMLRSVSGQEKEEFETALFIISTVYSSENEDFIREKLHGKTVKEIIELSKELTNSELDFSVPEISGSAMEQNPSEDKEFGVTPQNLL